MRSWIVALCLLLALFAWPSPGWPLAARADEAVPENPTPRWWKGNIHTHSLWSDGDDFPDMICEWYRAHGYNFLALSDHNILSEGPKWIKQTEVAKRGGAQALAKYRARFGGDWVETRGEGADLEIRLKPLSEFRSLVEERGKFVLFQGEEISDRAEGLPVHLNATNIQQLILPVGGKTVREAIANNVRAVEDQAARLGREILVHLNHPNYGHAVTAEDLAHVVEERFYEVYNGHPIINHQGDAVHPGVERLWDIANMLRLKKLAAPPLYGVATDDAHDYHDPADDPEARRRDAEPASTGRGWIMVRARYLTPEQILRAVKAADFYASSGVVLTEVRFDAASGELALDIAAEQGVEYTTQFIGCRQDVNADSEPARDKDGKEIRGTRKYSDEVGLVLAEVRGSAPRYRFQGDELYARATVTSSKPHPNPSFKGQREQAWTQPVGWEAPLAALTRQQVEKPAAVEK